MGALSVIGESPSPRSALARVSSAITQTEADIEAVLQGKDKLALELGKEAGLKQDLAERIVGEAASVIAAMKSGAQWALGRCGSRGTLKAAELLSASSVQTAIGEATLAAAAEELTRLSAQRERLLEARAALVKEVVRESIEPSLLEEWSDILTRLGEGLTQLTALRRYLEPATHDFVPGASRVAVTVPDFANGRDQAVVATSKAIGQVEAVLAQFAKDLERDPRAAAPELEVDTLEDPDTPYHALSLAERAAGDREFVAITQHRRTIDSELFETQAREANAFRAITN